MCVYEKYQQFSPGICKDYLKLNWSGNEKYGLVTYYLI